MALSFINRMWSRFKRTSAAPENSTTKLSDESHPIVEGNLVLQYDLELAVQADTSIRQAREIFDIDLLEQQPKELSSAPVAQEQFSFFTEPSSLTTEIASYDVEPPTTLSPVIETDDLLLNSFVESLRDKQLESPIAPDLSALISHALPFDSAIPPQLAKLTPKTSGRVSLEERAFARASHMGQAFGLGNRDIRKLAKILKRYRLHSSLIRKLEALLEDQYSADQLFTAEIIRRVWRRSEYARSRIIKAYSHVPTALSESLSPYRPMSAVLLDNSTPTTGPVTFTTRSIPSWRTAAKWARKLGNISSSELDSLLYHHYQRWTTNPSLWASQPSFTAHFSHLIRKMRHDLEDTLPWELACEPPPLDDYEEHQLERIRNKYLYALGLIPDMWIDPLDERLSIDPEFPGLQNYWPKKGEIDDDE